MAAGSTTTASSGTTTTTTTSSPCGACKFLRRKCARDCVFAPYFCTEQGPSQFAAIHKVFGASNVSKLLSHLPIHHRPEAVLTVTYEAQSRLRDPVYGCVAHIFALQQQVAYLQAQLMQVKTQIAASTGGSLSSSSSLRGGTTTNAHQLNLENTHQWQQLLANNNNHHHHSATGMMMQTLTPNTNNSTTNLVSSPQSSLEFATTRDHHQHQHQHHQHHHCGNVQINSTSVNTTNKDEHVSSYYMQAAAAAVCGKKMIRTAHGGVGVSSNSGDDGDYEMGELHEIAFRMMKN